MTRPTLDEMYYDSVKARPTRNRLQRDLGYDLIGLSAPTMLMPCSLVPWFQEYEVQPGGTREIIRLKRPQRLSHARLRRLTGKFSASCGQFFVVVRSQHGSLAPWLLHAMICTHRISPACGIPHACPPCRTCSSAPNICSSLPW